MEILRKSEYNIFAVDIYRELIRKFESILGGSTPQGLILTGIVGCGKTTLARRVLRELSSRFEIYEFTGDDVRFREAVLADSRALVNQLVGHKRALIFVDEVQKCDAVFDALKVAFDEAKVSFVVSGSNPEFLNTVAKQKLQRRADLWFMLPLSLPEILAHEGCAPLEDLLWSHCFLKQADSLPDIGVRLVLTDTIRKRVRDYLIYGGLPLVYLAPEPDDKLRQVRQTVERGFEVISRENSASREVVQIELARQQSQEFGYQGIIRKTRLTRREPINEVIDHLVNHGYLCKRRPIFLEDERKTYLSIFSYVDPGIVTYLSGEASPDRAELGHRVEGVVHARLDQWVKNGLFKHELGYFKPYVLDDHGKIKYRRGEIDFILKSGRRVLPMEVKLDEQIAALDTSALENLLREHPRVPFGVVFYGGTPFRDTKKRLLYWPFWAL